MIGGQSYAAWLQEVRDDDNKPLTAADVAMIGEIVADVLAGEADDDEGTN